MINNVRNPIAITHNPKTPWDNKTSQAINASNLIAGYGINLNYNSDGITISVNDDVATNYMYYTGDFDIDSSYYPGDVVTVPYDIDIVNQDGDVIPVGSTAITGSDISPTIPISIAAFVCVKYVPPSLYDEDYVSANVLSLFPGPNPPDQWINGTRFYDLNVYYPVYPEIPSMYTSSVTVFGSQCMTKANSTFWKCLGIGATTQNGGCEPDGNPSANYVASIQSGSVFQTTFLPYQPPGP